MDAPRVRERHDEGKPLPVHVFFVSHYGAIVR